MTDLKPGQLIQFNIRSILRPPAKNLPSALKPVIAKPGECATILSKRVSFSYQANKRNICEVLYKEKVYIFEVFSNNTIKRIKILR